MAIVKTDVGMFLTGGGSGGFADYHYSPFRTFEGVGPSDLDYIRVPDAASLDLNHFSVSLWFRTEYDFTPHEGMLILKGLGVYTTSADCKNYFIKINNTPFNNEIEGGFQEANGTGHFVFTDGVTWNDGLWHHVVLTYDGITVRLYVDGIERHTHATTATPGTNARDLIVGADPDETTANSRRQYNGDLDEIRVWNNDLTPSEVLALWQHGTVPQSGSIVYSEFFGGSGTSENIDPNLSLGGNVSSTQVVSGNLHNLFRRITETEASSGTTLYRCVAIKNKNTVDTMRNVVFYMVSDTKSPDDQSLYSFANAAKNTTETAIPDEFTAPTGTKINFIATLNRTGGLQLGDLAPTEYINVWLRVTVNPNAQAFPDNSFKVRVEADPTGGGGGSTPPDDPDTGVSFTMAAMADMSCSSNFNSNWTRIKNRNTSFVLFNGDDAYSSGSGCWTSAVGTTWRNKSITSFGNHDVDETEDQPETKNGLLNFYPILNGLTYAKHTFNNVGIVVVESGSDQSVSDAVGSAQYNFVKAALENFKANAAIEWIIVINHYPWYGPTSNHGNNTGGRDRYDPLFDANGVDIVIHGHNHNLWHSKLIRHNGTSSPIESGTDPNYSYSRSAANHGKVYIGSGAGGRSHYDIDSTPSYVVWSDDTNYGYTFLEFQSALKKCTIKFYNSSDTLLKSLTITHL